MDNMDCTPIENVNPALMRPRTTTAVADGTPGRQKFAELEGRGIGQEGLDGLNDRPVVRGVVRHLGDALLAPVPSDQLRRVVQAVYAERVGSILDTAGFSQYPTSEPTSHRQSPTDIAIVTKAGLLDDLGREYRHHRFVGQTSRLN